MIVHLKPSKQLAIILTLAHCVVTPLVWLLSIAFTLKCVITFLLIISLYYYLRQDALINFPWSVTLFKLIDAKRCELVTRNGCTVECAVLGISYVSAYLTVLVLRPVQHWRLRSVVIVPDNVDAEEFRRLRIMLRWKWQRA